eukprot:15459883-Alexandrium_andersonii.AAC.1
MSVRLFVCRAQLSGRAAGFGRDIRSALQVHGQPKRLRPCGPHVLVRQCGRLWPRHRQPAACARAPQTAAALLVAY